MSEERLRKALAGLHAELEDTEEVDEELQRLLGELDGDIHRLLHDDEPDSTWDSLETRAKTIADDFEDKHPRASLLLGQLAGMLSRMGI